MKNKIAAISIKLTWVFFSIITLSSCNKEDAEAVSYSITIGAFNLNSAGEYIATGEEYVINTEEECQTRYVNSVGDEHYIYDHEHHYAVTSSYFDNIDSIFNYIEYGPELDNETVEASCASKIGGTTKTLYTSIYLQDEIDHYLKIISVEEN